MQTENFKTILIFVLNFFNRHDFVLKIPRRPRVSQLVSDAERAKPRTVGSRAAADPRRETPLHLLLFRSPWQDRPLVSKDGMKKGLSFKVLGPVSTTSFKF